jgi:gliding motility-associated-like protein
MECAEHLRFQPRCKSAGGVTITTPIAMTVAFTKINDSCFGECQGRITAAVANGTSPYTLHWSNGTTGIRDSNLCAAIYTVTVTDSFSCTISAIDTVTQPVLLSAAIASINDSCFSQCNGRAVASGTGGSAPYTYLWSNGATGTTDSNLCVGIYTVTVKDANGCTAIKKDTITQPINLSATNMDTDVTCFGLCNGKANVIPSGGTAPYTYQWSNLATTEEVTSLCAGLYSVTVKDHNGCTAAPTHQDTIHQPSQLTIAVTNAVNDSCFGLCKGSITVAAAGGTTAYTYTWSNGGNGTTINGLCAPVTYTATVTDKNLCTATVSQAISQPAQLVADTLSTHQVSCSGGNDGAITLLVSGGTYPYSYTWPQIVAPTDSIATSLTAQTYTPTIKDAYGCNVTLSVVITQPALLAPYIQTLDSINCSGQTNGSVTVNANGGTQPYSYALDGSGTYQASGTFPGLTAGPHTVTVQDAHGCVSTIPFNIYEPAPVTSSIISTFNNLCFDSCNGVITVQGSGGVPPYEYAIDGGPFSNSPTFTNLCANPTYTISVQDNHTCPATLLVDSITQPSAIVPQFVSAIQPTCNNGTDGSFIVTASGGTPGYTYSSDNGAFQSSGSFSPETAGNHLVTVKDGNGCTDTLTVIVPNPPASSTFDTTVTEVTCPGGNNGAINLTINGALTPYTFSWSPGGATTQNIANLTAGTYVVTITDGHGCRVFGPDSIPVTQPGPITATDVMTPVSCFNDSDGCITVSPAGGTSPFTNSWSNGSTLSNPCGFAAGSYNDTLTDANGCQYIDAGIAVTQPTHIGILVDSVTLVSCIGYSNGAIYLSDTGGTPGYTYAWTPAGNTNPLTGLATGSYTVTVTDAHHCTDTMTIAVGLNSPMVLNANKSNVLCPPLQNGSVTLSITGGSPAYQYIWSNGAMTSSISGLAVGIDSVTVTDSRGCMIDTGFVISNDSSFKITAVPDTTATINEGDNIQLGLTIQAGSGDNYASITWSPNSGLSCANCQDPIATPLVTTQYTIQATSDSGCSATAQVLIIVVPQHQLYIPNAFTPNNDGINDYWEAFGNKKVWVYLNVEVFDRWGEKVFESNDLNYQWDGKYRGNLMEPGEYVYIFKVTFLDGYTVSNKGSITLIR